MPRVYNKHHKNAPADAVYIGRPSKWGNPFEIGKDGTREEVIAKFEQRIRERQDMVVPMIRSELEGKDLVCFCSPNACHGDVLLRIANSKGDPWANEQAMRAVETHGLPVPDITPPMPAVKEAFPKESLPILLKVIDDEIEYNDAALKTYADNKPTHALLTNKNFHLKILRKWILEQSQ